MLNSICKILTGFIAMAFGASSVFWLPPIFAIPVILLSFVAAMVIPSTMD